MTDLNAELRQHLAFVAHAHADAHGSTGTVPDLIAALVEMLDWADTMRTESAQTSGGVGRFFADEVERRLADALNIDGMTPDDDTPITLDQNLLLEAIVREGGILTWQQSLDRGYSVELITSATQRGWITQAPGALLITSEGWEVSRAEHAKRH